MEHGLYIPSVLPKSEGSWKVLFMEMYTRRHMWSVDEELLQETALEAEEEGMSEDERFVHRVKRSAMKRNETTDRFKVNVYARFRPHNQQPKESKRIKDAETEEGAEEGDEAKQVTLPLHQRLSMIRMSGEVKSNRDALRVLASEGAWFGQKWAKIQKSVDEKEKQQQHNQQGSDTKENSPSNLQDQPHKVDDASAMGEDLSLSDYMKLRKGEKALKFSKQMQPPTIAKVQTVDSGMAKVVMIAPDVGLREFSYDGVLPVACSQGNAYDLMARRLVMDFMNGYNGTCIAYGQTAAGKTHTMMGPNGGMYTSYDPQAAGIIPRACHDVLAALSDSNGSRARLGLSSSLAVSYVEVYGDLVTDLLRGGARVAQSKVASQSFVLSGAAEESVDSVENIMDCLSRGDAQKRRAATAMNDRSSRAHSIFILSLSQACAASGVQRTSKLFLADLGGSEQVKKSKVDAGAARQGGQEEFSLGFQMGERMKEAVNINLGLLALKKVIKALNEKSVYVPYQDSKLTMLLSAGLGGDCKTSVIINSSMDPAHASETVMTLRFGENCALIENEAKNNANMLAGVLAKLEEEIKETEAVIKVKERWEHRDIERVDENAEEGTFEAMGAGGVEIKKVSVLVGAEEERRRLQELLMRKASFVGSDEYEKEKQSATVGFGKGAATLYGVGAAFDIERDAGESNERFAERLEDSKLSAVVQARGARGWTTAEDLDHDPAELERKARKVRRNKLVYSGISA